VTQNGGRNTLLSLAGAVIVILLSVAGYLLAADRSLLERRDEVAAVALSQHERDIAALKVEFAEVKAGQAEALGILKRLERHARSDRPRTGTVK
jgi:hypothetical protein